MCEVGARCPACGTDLAPYLVVDKPRVRQFKCPCETTITITMPASGLVMTRQDAVLGP